MKVPFVHHDVATETEFSHYLDRYFKSQFDTHPILYLCFHGWGKADLNDAGICLTGKDENLNLTELEDLIDGRCRNRLIHFGACSTMFQHGNRLRRFKQQTNAAAICGYKKDVDWIESVAFELIMISYLQMVNLGRNDSMEKFRRQLQDVVPGLIKRLDFRLVY